MLRFAKSTVNKKATFLFISSETKKRNIFVEVHLVLEDAILLEFFMSYVISGKNNKNLKFRTKENFKNH